MLNRVSKLSRVQAIIQRNKDRAYLRDSVKRLKLRVGIGSDIGDSVSALDTQCLKRTGPPIATPEKLLIGKAEVLIHNRFTIGIQPARSPGEI
jgi:hypothetical protein